VEAEETGLRVIAARLTTLPYVDTEATVEILEAQQFNVLEAFILRAAHELQPVPTLEALAAMLGLDPLFVDASWQHLVKMRAVSLAKDGTPRLTERGRDYYLQGQLPPAASEAALRFRYWVVSDKLVVSDASAPPEVDAASGLPFPGFVARGAAEQEAAADLALKDLPRLVAATDEAGLGLHQPEEGRTINAVSSWQVTHTGAAACAILVVQETLATEGEADTLMLRVVDLTGARRFFDVEAVLRRWMVEGRVTLNDLLGDGGV
jgi:hypothetical protein